MTDYGFSDEAPERAQRAGGRRRPTMAGIAVTVGVLALLGLLLWAWVARSHADDLAAWDTLETTFEVMDRSLTPLGHGESPPCHTEPDGVVTRTYPPSTGPQAAAVIGYLTQLGWTVQNGSGAQPSATGSAPSDAAAVLAVLTKSSGGRDLTVVVSGPSLDRLVGPVTGRSPGSTIGCLGR
ncbi:hypothetical protein [Humibacillus xanthopallidus]|uniref:Uncharacterized protein n=1 Tax=Humibacillus xanthopallidus TaxID=412689 RepID=A0A543HGT0_9MICO|nr:hypothetical protein [Humibacillus xanthopallidus]TQM57526.1 hypothetical protein FBY41_4354 [Humibacillus xanthopallidus]